MRYDDGSGAKSFQQKLTRPDLRDQMSQRYTAGRSHARPIPKNHDPGRFRHEPFFKKMYGSTAKEVRSHLTDVSWSVGVHTSTVRITEVNGVDERLAAVARRLRKLPRRLRRKFLSKKPSTYVWRTIRSTRRLSTHSFGIAVDVAIHKADYWRWSRLSPTRALRYRNRIPLAIVEAFEREGFIWGGKWYHYDTMHFEYRPELLVSPCVEKGSSPRTPASPRPR